jgi:hypothetical protein
MIVFPDLTNVATFDNAPRDITSLKNGAQPVRANGYLMKNFNEVSASVLSKLQETLWKLILTTSMD